MFPATFKLLPTPIPPATTNAPDVVLVLEATFDTETVLFASKITGK